MPNTLILIKREEDMIYLKSGQAFMYLGEYNEENELIEINERIARRVGCI